MGVEGVVAVDEEYFFALEAAVGGDLDGEGGFACFRFTIDEGDGGGWDSAVEVVVYAGAACAYGSGWLRHG